MTNYTQESLQKWAQRLLCEGRSLGQTLASYADSWKQEIERLRAEVAEKDAQLAAAKAELEEVRNRSFLDDVALEAERNNSKALEAECKALRVDAERYRWLRDNWFYFGTMNDRTRIGASLSAVAQAGDVQSLDAAIDAAKAGGDV